MIIVKYVYFFIFEMLLIGCVGRWIYVVFEIRFLWKICCIKEIIYFLRDDEKVKL